MRAFLGLCWAFVIVALAGAPAYAQGGGSSAPLSGLVVDQHGGPVPGAAVTVRDEASGTTYEVVTNAKGNFTIPALHPGTYAVTVSITGFKQAVFKGNKLLSATPLDLKVTLEVGTLEETLTVEGVTPLVQTQSAAISNTIEVNAITQIPVQSRNALDFITFQPGVQTPAGNRDSIVSGLDQSAINVTVDGMSVQDNFLKTTDGFFARLAPRLDMVEEVTLTTAAGNADSTGMGAAQVNFTTRRGTNEYHGSVYWYARRDWLNANTWFNNRDLYDPATGESPRTKLRYNIPGFRFGGPIRIPGLFDGRDRAHFFINYEEQRIPSDVSRNRTILSPAAQQGIFRYSTAAGVREVNLLQLAAANGQVSTVDPTIARVLQDIRNAAAGTGSVADLTDPNVQRYTFQSGFSNVTRYPTVRLDFQLTRKHLLTMSGTMNKLLSDPDTLNNRDPSFPGFPVGGVQDSKRFIGSATLRSTLSPNLVNELRIFGASGGATLFSTEINPSMWLGTPVADQAGYQLNFNGACCATTTTGTANQANNLTNASGVGNSPNVTSREAGTRAFYNHLIWLKGSHSFSFGVDFTQVDVWLKTQLQVPTIGFGVTSDDPAAGLFTTANFPGASAANLNAARGLYAILTGRVQGTIANARLDPGTDQYGYLGLSKAQGRMREFDFFVHDTWRVKPNLTVNYGLRYALQLPLYPLNNSYATATLADIYGVSGEGNLFKPGIAGSPPVFVQYKEGEKANATDWNNFAPSLGFAWQPTLDGGFLRAILGSEPVIRAGFSMAYSRNGMSDFTDTFGANPGIVIDVNRNQTLGNLGPTPLLFRDQLRLAPPSFPTAPSYPITNEPVDGDVRIFDPNLKVPYSQTWSASVQRQLSKTMALDLRYIGSRGRDLWGEVNYNESNIIENGFLDEFRLAQQNLQANIQAGRGNSFAYFGPGTGTSPLPIYLAYLNGAPASQAGNAARYTGSSWSDPNFTNPLALFWPQPFTPAGSGANGGLDGSLTRRTNAQAAGLPANFFRANPNLLGGAFVRTNRDFTDYHGFEVWLQKRYSRGIYFNAGYTLGSSHLSNFYSQRRPSVSTLNTGAEGGVTHAFKFWGGWDLPVGKGRKFAGNANGFVDAFIGGWQLTWTARVQSGRLLDFGNVRLVGMSKRDLEKMFKLRFDDAGRKVYMLPQDVIDNTVRAFSVSATSPTGYGALGAPSGRYLAPANGPNCIEPVDPAINDNQANVGYGDCGEGELVVTGPMFKMLDLGIAKEFQLGKSVRLQIRAELLNAFNLANFVPVAANGTGTVNTYTNVANYEVTQLVNGSDSPRIAQVVARINW